MPAKGETPVASSRLAAEDIDVSGGAQALEGLQPDRLFVNAMTPLPTAASGGTLTVNVFHSYPAPLHNVRLSIAGTDYTSETVAAMRPTELRSIAVPVERLDATGKGTTEVQVVLACDELREPATFPVIVPLTEDDRSIAEASLAMPVGELQVRVQRFGDWYAFAWGAPLVLVAIGAFALARRRR